MDAHDVLQIKALISENIHVSIQGESDEQQAPAFHKTLNHVESCPDQTHLRLYFDSIHFVAIPFTARLTWQNGNFYAYDSTSQLSYQVRRE